jgi:hypothetical protein
VANIVPAVTVHADRAAVQAEHFVLWLLMASLLPIPLFAWLSEVPPQAMSAQAMIQAIVVLNLWHVGLTSLFWIDPRYRAHMAGTPRPYYGHAAAILVFVVAGMAIGGSRFVDHLAIMALAWNVFHFGRQNWGVLCLAAQGTGSARPGRLEFWACHLGCMGGILGVMPDHALGPFGAGARVFGLALGLAGAGMALLAIRRGMARGMPPLRLFMTIAVALFFLPAYAFPRHGFTAIAAAHTGQYVVIMMVLAADRTHGSRLARIGGMLGLATLYVCGVLLLAQEWRWGEWSRTMTALGLTVVMWHFVVDAGVFRLSEPEQRRAFRESFAFLFARPAAGRGAQE